MNNLKRASVWIPLIVAIAFIVGFLAGDIVNRQSGPTPTQKKFQTILNLIRKDYVDEVDLDSVLEKTLPSMLANLDPHSLLSMKSYPEVRRKRSDCSPATAS